MESPWIVGILLHLKACILVLFIYQLTKVIVSFRDARSLPRGLSPNIHIEFNGEQFHRSKILNPVVMHHCIGVIEQVIDIIPKYYQG